jgi:PAS domain S-box-containing protein
LLEISRVPKTVTLTGHERTFAWDDVIVSKTDLKGRITYANRVFIEIAGFTEKELLGQPHSIIRHPDMPRCVFKLLWSTLEAGNEIFAYVINRCKNGDHYWVYAHVTPSFDSAGNIIGYHSNRRVPERVVIDQHIIPLYSALLEEEKRHASRKDGMLAAEQMVLNLLAEHGLEYDEFLANLRAAA